MIRKDTENHNDIKNSNRNYNEYNINILTRYKSNDNHEINYCTNTNNQYKNHYFLFDNKV